MKKSGCDFIDRYRMFAILKLESYGFHKSHCLEALEFCKGDVDAALELLFVKYFPAYTKSTNDDTTNRHNDNETLEMRRDEISSLQSIYDTSFEEQQPNRVWQLKLKIDHLLVHSPSEQRKRNNAKIEQQKKAANHGKPMALCRNYAKGKCKYGSRCRFSHVTDCSSTGGSAAEIDPDLDVNWFYLEIRFPTNSRYPFEAPMLFLKTTCPDIPLRLCLRITRKIVDEAKQMAKDGMASVYSVSDLLQQDEEIASFLRNDRYEFLDGKRSLFHVYENDVNDNDESAGKPKATHYDKGSTGRSDAPKLSIDQMRKNDLNLVQKFMDKQNQTTYKTMLKARQSLPAWPMMTKILDTIDSSQVVVISGETGCGKSTQVPQFILDEWMLRSATAADKSKIRHVEIVCTQPRRISAIGVAERVAAERGGERVGNTVGYQIRLENKISSDTRLTFCTTGILLRRLQSDDQLDTVSHVLVDEVHERSEESDFLLLILKELLMKRSDLKVILMSATLNAKLFSDYFNGCPILEIPGRTFPVEQIFLEEILDRSKFVLEADSHFCRKLNKNEEHQLLNELEYSDVVAANAAPPKSIRDENLPMADLFARYNGE